MTNGHDKTLRIWDLYLEGLTCRNHQMRDEDFERQVLRRLERIETLLALGFQLDLRTENHMSAEFDALKAQVAAVSTVDQSAITLLNGLHDKLATVEAQLLAAGQDAAAITALKDSLAADTAGLAAAVSANTPAAPAASPTTPPATPPTAPPTA